jgi:hypothetical protein
MTSDDKSPLERCDHQVKLYINVPSSFWRETSQSPGTLIVDQPMTNNQRPTTEELKYSRDRAWRHQRPTNNLLEVWQNLAPFSSRPISSAVEALLTKVVNWQSSVSPIVVIFVAAAVSLMTRPNSAESIILSAGGNESMMLLELSAPALGVSILKANAESIILSAPSAESMILSVLPADATCKHRHSTLMMHHALTASVLSPFWREKNS